MSLIEVSGLHWRDRKRRVYPHLLLGTLMIRRPLPRMGGFIGMPLHSCHHEVTYPRHEPHALPMDRARRKPKPIKETSR